MRHMRNSEKKLYGKGWWRKMLSKKFRRHNDTKTIDEFAFDDSQRILELQVDSEMEYEEEP